MIAVLDIETRNFTQRFQRAKSDGQRVLLAPPPTVACIYWVQKRKYEFFARKRLDLVVPSLTKATCIVTFHGERFDFLVLERWCGLQRTTPFLAKSLDLSRIVGANRFRFLKQPSRKGVNLDRCGKLNFGVPRKATGTNRDRCRAHVRLTYQLFEAFRTRDLMVPVRPPVTLPRRCPECRAEAELIPFQPDYDEMSEGQIFDYELGQQGQGWGFARCTRPRCRQVFAWGI